jgi:HlyD family secretion protein
LENESRSHTRFAVLGHPGVERKQPVAAPPAPLLPRKPNRRGWLWIACAAVLAVAILTSRDKLLNLPSAVRAAPHTVQVREGSLERTLRLTGSTAGEHSITLRVPYMRGSRSRGGGAGDFHLVLKDLIAQGTRVKEGDTLATFDRQVMMDRLDNLKADQVQSEATLKSLQASLLASREAREQQLRVSQAAVDAATLDLKTAPVRSAIQVNLFQLNLEEARAQYRELLAEGRDFDISQHAQVRAGQLTLDQSALEVRRAETNAERMVVRAPRAGLVVIRETVRNNQLDTIRAGDELRPGQPYIDIVAPGPMIVEARVNQADVRRIRIGAVAQVVPEAFPDMELPAKVYAIGSLAASTGWRGNFVREVPVLLRIGGSHPRVIPSLTVNVDVVLSKVDHATLVPREAVFTEAPGRPPFAFVQAGEGWERRELDVTLTSNTLAAVRSGLERGDMVATGIPADFTN